MPNIYLVELIIMKGDKETARELLLSLLKMKKDPTVTFRTKQLLDGLELNKNIP